MFTKKIMFIVDGKINGESQPIETDSNLPNTSIKASIEKTLLEIGIEATPQIDIKNTNGNVTGLITLLCKSNPLKSKAFYKSNFSEDLSKLIKVIIRNELSADVEVSAFFSESNPKGNEDVMLPIFNIK